MKRLSKEHFLLHLLVFIWGWTAILGKLISIQALQLVWHRMLIAISAIAFYFIIKKHRFKVNTKDLLLLFGVGIVIAIHWLAFYHAIKVSNVSITLVAFSTGTLFTSIVEPLFFKRKIALYELLFGLIIIGAIALIFKIEIQYAAGIVFGILAAFTSSLFTVWNSMLVRKIEAHLISFYELLGGFLFLSIYLFLSNGFNEAFFILSASDTLWLFILGIAATAFPFIVSVHILKKLNPFTVSLTLNLETIYGIIFAYIIWQKEEQMSAAFYISTALVLITLIVNGIIKSKKIRK